MTISFTAMTWNLENLFPVGSPSGPKTAEAYAAKMRNLATVIRLIGPDMLAVQEVGDPAAFADLQHEVGDAYPHGTLSSFPDVRGIRVGFLSRLPFMDRAEFHDFPAGALRGVPDAEGGTVAQMGRGALRVTVSPADGHTIRLLTAHLKSKLITYPHGRRFPHNEDERARGTGFALLKRAAEAVALRVHANELLANNAEPLIVLGDMNDGPDAVTTQTLLGPEDGSLARPDKFDDVRLYNLAEYIPADRRFSRIYRQNKELIDHIMVSHDLIFARRQTDSYIEPITSIDESTETRRNALFPDHAPLFARF
jgi:endonuclease/exonuclease/phosphatase family metal-dependent hydrolase